MYGNTQWTSAGVHILWCQQEEEFKAGVSNLQFAGQIWLAEPLNPAHNFGLYWVSPTRCKVPVSGVELDASFLSQGHSEPGRVRNLSFPLALEAKPGLGLRNTLRLLDNATVVPGRQSPGGHSITHVYS